MKRMWSKNELKEIVKSTPKDITTLVDSQGHDRFIEGSITYPTTTGVEQKYGKWSLSGSHLLIVLALQYADATELEYKSIIINNLPQWILDKIYPVASNLIEYKAIAAFASDYSTQNQSCYLLKYDNLTIELGNLTLTKDRTIRIAFDLLIDND